MWACCQPTGSVALALEGSSSSLASPILLSPKRLLLAGPPCRDWHKACVSCGGIRSDGQAGRIWVSDRLLAQHDYGLCFDDQGATVPWDT
jgi:hypothetical protein